MYNVHADSELIYLQDSSLLIRGVSQTPWLILVPQLLTYFMVSNLNCLALSWRSVHQLDNAIFII